MLGALMFASKIIMELLPNIHLIGMFIVTFTVVFRWKALYPIYIFVFITGLYSGFAPWWIPYLYIWTVLWAIVMLLPKSIPKKAALIIYPLISALHGICYGILYAPTQALLFGLDFNGMIAWIIAGFPFDIIHGISNLVTGFLILPFADLIKKILQKSH
jgi:energy-coupling factor transport system substrate-specific component